MSKRHPYAGMPDYQFWRKETGIQYPDRFDPVTDHSFTISQNDSIVTAGSCFAQHVARYLLKSGFNLLLTEKAHDIIPIDIAKNYNYGVFSARYGNIYTALQLKQLIQRAFGEFSPIEKSWAYSHDSFVDPFRPQIHPGGFISETELLADLSVHLSAVKKAFESMDIFVFTLGLTEAWLDQRDGAVFPLAPGVAGGLWDEKKYKFINFDLEQTVSDLQWSIDYLRRINPNVRLLLTVSPVPLNATAVNRHVFVSTTYSKSVLRVAAETICRKYPMCDYFPSYEVITSPFVRGHYYANDCREVIEDGVRHVMHLFLKHYGGLQFNQAVSNESPVANYSDDHLERMEEMIKTLCDEESIGNQ
jgi:hypothetical protein